MNNLIACTRGLWLNLRETKIRASLEISKLEVKAKFDDTNKDLNRDRGNIANKNFWNPLFPKINLVTQSYISLTCCNTCYHCYVTL